MLKDDIISQKVTFNRKDLTFAQVYLQYLDLIYMFYECGSSLKVK